MEIVLKIRNVKKDGDWYHFRKVIPEDVRHLFGGQVEIKQSLETQDPLVADRLARPLRKEWTLKIQAARHGSAIEANERPSVHAVKFADDYVRQHIKDADLVDLKVLNDTQLEPLLDDLHAALESDQCGLVKLARLVGEYGLFQWEAVEALVAGRSGRKAYEFVLSMTTLIREALLEEGAFAKLGGTPKLHANLARQMRDCAENPPRPLLSEVLEKVIKVDESGRDDRFRTHISYLMEWFGDKSVDRYPYDDLIAYRNDCLYRLPDRRKEPFKSMTLREAVGAKAEAMSRETVINHMRSIDTLFKHVIEQYDVKLRLKGLIPKKERKGNRAKDRKTRYTKDELQRMINLLPTVKDSPVRFWVPLIALYQGARLNEVCQLHTDDVYLDEDSGLWVLSFNDDDARRTKKSIKTDASSREVPVHPALISLGFVSFVEVRKQGVRGKSAVLFEDVKYSEKHHYNRPVTRWFNEGKAAFKRQFLTEERAKVMHFHRFRNTWIQQARNQARMDATRSKELRGHTAETEVNVGYSDGIHPLALLLEDLQKLDYDLDLSPIMGQY